jgi:glycosyltransferase involved in cell wall biosynthesis
MATGDRPRISAVISAYNCAPYLAEAIDSVLAQTRPPDEIVVVDDGSTDDTAAVAARYAGRGVRYVHQRNQGAGAARNRGVQETTGDMVAFLDGDDLWLPEKLAKQEAFLLANPGVDMVSCFRWQWNTIFDKRVLERFGTPPGTDMRRENVVRNVVGNPSMALVRRSLLQVVGPFDTTLRWGQDWDLFIRILERATVAFIPEPLMVYRWHMSGLTNTNGWERLNVVWGISRRAIGRYRPAYWRPLMLARSWSLIEYDRAHHAVRYRMGWKLQSWHALCALAAWPFERTVPKVKLLGRALIGETLYWAVKRPRAAEGQ